MSVLIAFTVPGRPVSKARPRFVGKVVYVTPETRRAEAMVRGAAKLAIEAEKKNNPDARIRFPSKAPLRMRVVFHLLRPKSSDRLHPTTRPDLDNYLKLVMDACNDLIWKDDAQLIAVTAEKIYSETEGTVIEVTYVD